MSHDDHTRIYATTTTTPPTTTPPTDLPRDPQEGHMTSARWAQMTPDERIAYEVDQYLEMADVFVHVMRRFADDTSAPVAFRQAVAAANAAYDHAIDTTPASEAPLRAYITAVVTAAQAHLSGGFSGF